MKSPFTFSLPQIMLIIGGFYLLGDFALTLEPTSKQFSPERNILRVGETAQADPIRVPIAAARDLNFLKRSEVLDIRRQAVHRAPQLIDQYHASEYVFGRIEDDLPWWSLRGELLLAHGIEKGQDRIAGLSFQSIAIGNPYLLLTPICGAVFSGLPKRQRPKDDTYPSDQRLIKDAESIPYPHCTAVSLTYFPRESLVRAGYDFDSFESRARAKLGCPFTVLDRSFSLQTLNASDFGYQYLKFDPNGSSNIMTKDKHRQLIASGHFIHKGPSCGYPGGCNNISPFISELQGFRIKELPAIASFNLWKSPPLIDQKPDLTYNIHFELNPGQPPIASLRLEECSLALNRLNSRP